MKYLLFLRNWIIDDGDKLDEHLIKALEDALFEWKFPNKQASESLKVGLELLLSPIV